VADAEAPELPGNAARGRPSLILEQAHFAARDEATVGGGTIGFFVLHIRDAVGDGLRPGMSLFSISMMVGGRKTWQPRTMNRRDRTATYIYT
jgi:hypothetical protein